MKINKSNKKSIITTRVKTEKQTNKQTNKQNIRKIKT